jgi:UDP-glucose 4-epimerase
LDDFKKNVFVTGGSGYIGSHTCIELLNAGYNVTVYDNFSNSHPEAMVRVQKITGKNLKIIQGDIRDEGKLLSSLIECNYSAVIHFAGLKAVAESTLQPINYYDNNVQGTLCLIRAMKSVGVKRLIFSSSATVYGEPKYLPITEDHPLSATNPYGRSKLFIEEILRDLFKSQSDWSIMILRYFNPTGAHESGLIGEDPQGSPNNLMPIIAQVALGRRDSLKVYGNDYSTPDGSGIRDFVHVCDLALGHVMALKHLIPYRCSAINLGTGKGNSVFEVIQAFEYVSGKKICFEVVPRRIGDVAACYADTNFASNTLQWIATRDIIKMCHDSWVWQSNNPLGYKS